MGLVVLLVPGAPEQISLGTDSASALAELGITSVALVRGAGAVGLVLEGWAFDPSRAHEAAAAVGAASATPLTTVAQMAVSTARSEDGVAQEQASTSPILGRVESREQSTGEEE